jgi:hypothetical protein
MKQVIETSLSVCVIKVMNEAFVLFINPEQFLLLTNLNTWIYKQLYLMSVH